MKSNLNTLASDQNQSEDFSQYVAHLQLHMALQARNLVPSIKSVNNSREQLLQETQADFEKIVSRHQMGSKA
ncbi:MAG: hypothetical protein VKJ64_10805 [Leptolyngbyaceae bacterium]|nr:hypothetical protein [Leptolyngbyaceae bacterium]